jgi:alanine dehydrogenase
MEEVRRRLESNSPQQLYGQRTIRSHLPLEDVIDRVRDAFLAQARGEVQMPAKNYLLFNDFNGDLRTMSAYVPEFELATVKIVNSHPDNPAQHDLPTVMALIVAVDPETGYPVAVLDGTEITTLRTAAASAIATDAFAPGDVDTLGIIGAGGQAASQVEGQLIVRDFSTVWIYDIDSSKAQSLCDELDGQYPDVQFQQAESLETLIDRSQVINSLTPGTDPLVETIPEDAPLLHLNAMGADGPGKQEWPVSLLKSAAVFVDDREQARHSGEIHTGLEEGTLSESDVEGSLGDYLLSGESSLDSVTVFDSTGLAIQDTAATKAFLQQDVDPDGTFPFFGNEESP